MARAQVIHSEDCATIVFNGEKSKPEPSQAVIKFPGGHVEVTRTSDGKYWAHIGLDDASTIANSRIDYDHDGYVESGMQIPDIPHADHIKHMAVLVSK